MKLTKFVHSCLLIEDQNTAILVDPGMFSVDSIQIDKLPKLDYLLITHEHPDHFLPDFVGQLVAKNPQIQIISNQSVVDQLAKGGVEASTKPTENIAMQVVPHADLWLGAQPPLNSVFTVFGKLTIPGDTLGFSECAEVLALPIFAPWGSFKWAIETVQLAQPKKVIPVHDWFLKPEAQAWHFERATEACTQLGVEFVPIKDGEQIEV